MVDIAKAAGLTEPGLLHHFPSKTKLLMEVLAERDRIDHERFDPAVRGEQEDALTSLQKLVEYNKTVPGLVQLFTILVGESIEEQHPGHDFFMRRYQKIRAQDIDVLKQGQERGDIRNDIPAEDLAVMLFAMMDGLQIQWLFEPQKVDMARIFEQFVRLLRAE
jgi:AcrR family transcriptional regulator